MSDTVQTSTELSTLQIRLEALNALIERLRSLRNIPAHLIRLPQSRLQSFAPLEGPHFLPQAFQELKETVECVRSEKVQEALVTARDSEQKDKSDLRLGRPRVNRKRK